LYTTSKSGGEIKHGEVARCVRGVDVDVGVKEEIQGLAVSGVIDWIVSGDKGIYQPAQVFLCR
jgi:hypothetical protein